MQTEQAEIDRLRAQGITGLETVGEIIEGTERPTPPSPGRFEPARLGTAPKLPEPGLYFGMTDEEYHALPALSNHGIKKLAASPMIFWANTPWLSEKAAKRMADRQADEKQHHVFGKAYHCRLMEGTSAFAQRFVVELNEEDYPNALVHTDQIKAAISRHVETVPVKPCSARKDELTAQLVALTTAPASTVEGLKVDDLKAAIRQYTCEQPVKPWAKVADFMPDTGEEYQRTAVKADWIRQLQELEPDAEIFDVIQAEHLARHEGKSQIPYELFEQLEIAAHMLDQDPELIDAFRNGHAEVVLIWYCEKTGVPMKAKLDYLKLDEIVDLKTVANQRDRSIEQAIRFEISSYHYNFQPIVYFEGVDAVRKIVRKSVGKGTVWKQAEVVKVEGEKPVKEWVPALGDELTWALKWAKIDAPAEFMWVFQQKGDAPITRGVRFPRGGITHEGTEFLIDRAKRHFMQFSEVYGTDPWLDVKPVYIIADEDIPRQATEI